MPLYRADPEAVFVKVCLGVQVFVIAPHQKVPLHNARDPKWQYVFIEPFPYRAHMHGKQVVPPLRIEQDNQLIHVLAFGAALNQLAQ